VLQFSFRFFLFLFSQDVLISHGSYNARNGNCSEQAQSLLIQLLIAFSKIQGLLKFRQFLCIYTNYFRAQTKDPYTPNKSPICSLNRSYGCILDFSLLVFHNFCLDKVLCLPKAKSYFHFQKYFCLSIF
jgi:hypothetical protein